MAAQTLAFALIGSFSFTCQSIKLPTHVINRKFFVVLDYNKLWYEHKRYHTAVLVVFFTSVYRQWFIKLNLVL